MVESVTVSQSLLQAPLTAPVQLQELLTLNRQVRDWELALDKTPRAIPKICRFYLEVPFSYILLILNLKPIQIWEGKMVP